MTQSTKITFDVADALKKLRQLQDALDETADKADDLDDEGGGLFDSLADKAESLIPGLSGVSGGVRGVVAALGPMAAVAGAAAAGVALIAANLIDLPFLLRDTQAGMEEFNDAVDRQLDLRNKLSSVSDALINSKTRRELDALRLEGADISARQGEITAEKFIQQEKINELKKALKIREQIVKDSAKRESAAQRILDQEKVSEVEQVRRDPALTEGRRALELASRAEQEAQKGNLELAQKFRDAAQEVTDELGGHVFFQKEVDAATQSIVDKAQEQVDNENKLQAAQEQINQKIQDAIALREAELDKLKKETAELTKQAGIITKRRTETRVRRREELTQQSADEAGREANAAAVKIRNELDRGGRSLAENIKDSLKLSFSNLTAAQRTQSGLSTEREAFQAFQRIAERVFDADGATSQDVIDLGPEFERLKALVGSLQEAREAGTLPSGMERSLQQLERIVNTNEQLIDAAAKFLDADRDPNQRIQEGAEAPFSQLRKRADEGAGKLNDFSSAVGTATDRVNALGATGTQAQQVTASAGAPEAAPAPSAPAAAVSSNITVNANVKGGIIDREVTEKITDIIRRELRKTTSQGATQSVS